MDLPHLLSNMVLLKMFARGVHTVNGVGIGAAHVAGLAIGSAIFGGVVDLWFK